MRAFVTGGTGFIGAQLVAQLHQRGDQVVASVRPNSNVAYLQELGCETVSIDLSDRKALAEVMSDCDAVYHLAARFEIGIPAKERNGMLHANVSITESVIDAAIAASVGRIVYASTINVFGDTNGAVVDERFRRRADSYLSLYDESKFLAHEAIMRRVADGAPIVLVQPGVVYGPGDHFEIGRQILLAAQGKLPMLMMGDVGFTMAFVDDVAAGFIAAHDRGETGQGYVLGGEAAYLSDVLALSAELAGVSFRPIVVPTALLKLIAPLGPLVGPKLGYPSNFKELIRVSDGTTYWADDGEARRQLGYDGRDLREGLKATLAAADLLKH